MIKSIILLVLSALLIIMLSCSEDETTAPEDTFGMGDAIALVIDSILGNEVTPEQEYRCIGMGTSIPEGSVIEEFAPKLRLMTGAKQTAAVSMQTTERSFFFLLDLAPATMYEHDVKYITVGESGDYEVKAARWWPVIDGQTPEQFLVAEPDDVYIIDGNFNIKIDPGQVPVYQFEPMFRQYKEGFIVVQGLMPTEPLYSDSYETYDNGIAFFTSYKGSEDLLDGMVEGAADNVLNMIDYFAAEGVDIITIYIIAHGGTNYVCLGGYAISASNFASRMSDHPDVLFNFLIGSCHSGSFIDDLSPLANVRVVLSSCSSDEGAKPDWDEAYDLSDYNPEDIGSEWTSSLIRASEIIVDTPADWTQILTWASVEGVPPTCMLLYQAGCAALGETGDLGTFDNLDLSNRTGHTTPGFYCSW